MDARVMVDGKSTVDIDRCIGCGNCVVTCTSGASSLVQKEEKLVPFKDKDTTFMKIMSRKLSTWDMLKLRMKMMLGMKV
jgi:Fe-S-cluster-containing hydrogenase component 2